MQNSIVGNEVSESGVADLGFGSLQTDLASLGNCFDGNTFTTTAPTDLEGLAPCEGEPTATDWATNALDLVALMGAEKPPSVDYETAPTPEPPDHPNMPEPDNPPAQPAPNVPAGVDHDALALPKSP